MTPSSRTEEIRAQCSHPHCDTWLSLPFRINTFLLQCPKTAGAKFSSMVHGWGVPTAAAPVALPHLVQKSSVFIVLCCRTGCFHPTDVVFNLSVNWQMHILHIMRWTNSPSFENNCRWTRLGPLPPCQCFNVYLPSSSEITVHCASSAVLRRRSSHRPDMQSPAVHLHRASLAVGSWRPATAWLS
jgi:hypothetical protein